MAKDVVAKSWVPGSMTFGSDGRYYSNPDQAPSGSGGDLVASIWSLEIVCPRAVGNPPDFPANHIFFRQPTGVEYVRKLAAIGGVYPHQWTVSNAPVGLVIREMPAFNGNPEYEAYWPTPLEGTYSDIVFEVEDAVGATADVTINLVVDDDDHVWLDSSAVSSGTGTRASPFQQMVDLYDDDTLADKAAWFVGGGPSYVTDGIPTTDPPSPGELRVEFDDADGRCVTWMADPDSVVPPVIDFGSGGAESPRIRMTGEAICVNGFDCTNIYVMGFQMSSRSATPLVARHGLYFRHNTFDLAWVQVLDSNQAFLMTVDVAVGVPCYCSVVADNTYSNVGHEDVCNAIKFYNQFKCFHSGDVASDMDIPFEYKDYVQFHTRNITAITNIGRVCFGGNWADNTATYSTSGDFLYNFLKAEGTPSPGPQTGAMVIGNNRPAGDGPGHIRVGRSTIIGGVVIDGLESTQGPIDLIWNVICNDEGSEPIPNISTFNSSDEDRIVDTENLKGTLVDARIDPDTGELLGAWAEDNYFRGHRLTP